MIPSAKSDRELVEEFASCVAAQSEAIARGDAATGNRFAARYTAACAQLRGRGAAGRDALMALLDDPRDRVRVMAASYLLRHCEAAALAVLEKEAGSRGLAALGARQTLERWREGTWTLDVGPAPVPKRDPPP